MSSQQKHLLDSEIHAINWMIVEVKVRIVYHTGQHKTTITRFDWQCFELTDINSLEDNSIDAHWCNLSSSNQLRENNNNTEANESEGTSA